jgi:hypothetical protein
MKHFFYIVIISLIVGACGDSSEPVKQKSDESMAEVVAGEIVNEVSSSVNNGNLLTLADAEKILGEPAYLKDSSSTRNNNAYTFSSSYMATARDPENGKTGAIYFLYEKYNDDAAAHKKYLDIKTANADNGIKERGDLGDEAYFHSDGTNFYFMMIRKGPYVLTMKVNKITRKTSLDEFNKVAGELVQRL